jgi:ZIP family zinc transporter
VEFEHSVSTVFIAAMLTALATGLGALPFLFLRSVDRWWIAIANAAAAGLMLAATHTLIAEGVALDVVRLIAGVLIGLAAIVVAQHWLNDADDVKFGKLSLLDARKAFLLIAVMTAHSFAEGVGHHRGDSCS